MKKKILLLATLALMLACVFALSVSAAEMKNYCTVDLTLTNGETVTAYCAVAGGQMKRDNLYKTIDNEGEKYNWEDVVIFDCRNQVVVGGVLPRAFSGVGCNDLAKNVTTVYIPEHFTYFLNSTFTSGWASLETIYVPASVTKIKGFSGAPVKNVIFAEGSQLEAIEGDAFSNCTNLVNINISDCKNLKSIGGNAFRNCTSLTTIEFPDGVESMGKNAFYTSALSGTVVVPNSVTVLDAGAFLSTKIETLILGDGAVTIDYNFAGSTGNQYLKNVYISAESVLKSLNTFYRCANAVNFYIVGEDCEAVKEALLGQQASNYYMTFVLAEDATESMGAGYGIIHTGVNRCEVFYGNEHNYDEESALDSCLTTCLRCKESVLSGGDHSYKKTESFEGVKYASQGTVTNACAVCGLVESETGIGVIIRCLGYSASEYGTYGITVGYVISRSQMDVYEKATGKSLAYGVFAISKAKLGQGDIFGENGPVGGVITFDLSKYEFSAFEMKVTGISEAQKDAKLAIGAYIEALDGEASEFTCIQNGEAAEGEKYCFVSYSEIAD